MRVCMFVCVPVHVPVGFSCVHGYTRMHLSDLVTGIGRVTLQLITKFSTGTWSRAAVGSRAINLRVRR